MELEFLKEIEVEGIDMIGPKGDKGDTGPQGPKGDKGNQGEPGAVKMQVVDTLPETGRTDTIYLVKKDNPGEQNLYDEYVYTETGWEHIGDTSVDLSDYYTKEESNEKIFDSLPVLYTSVAIGTTTTKESDIKSASEVVNALYKNGKKMFVYHNSSYEIPDVVLSFPKKILKEKSRYDSYGCYNETAHAYITVIRGICVYINGTWDNEVFTCTSVQSIRSNDTIKAVNVASTITDTTTDSVQGKVVKKYVDDAVANINIPMYTITTTKSFMDGYVNFETDVINKLTEIVNKNLDIGFELYIVDTFNRTFRFDIHMNTPNDTSNVSTGVIGYGLGNVFYNKVRKFKVEYSAKDGLYTFSRFVSDGTQVVTFKNEVLTKDNTDVYTPTGNYHPSTKLYTDKTHYENMTGYDATKTQVLKNINGTLTWVNEE